MKEIFIKTNIKFHLIIILILLEFAILSLGRPTKLGSAIPLSEINNYFTCSANQIGALFPNCETYNKFGKMIPLYNKGKEKLIIFISCNCDITVSTEWANSALLNNEDVQFVFLGHPNKLDKLLKDHSIMINSVTCTLGKANSVIGNRDILHLPIGYHINSDGILISRQE